MTRKPNRARVAPRWTFWPDTIGRVAALVSMLRATGISADRQGRMVSASSVAERALEIGLRAIEDNPSVFAERRRQNC